MEDYSNLKGSGSVAAPSERVWGVQKKTKTGERGPQNGRRHEREKVAGESPDNSPERLEPQGEEPACPEGLETPGYGAHRGVKKTSRQVDLVI
ncbi:MAG: hypothetical protein AB1512_28570 [Thermodesulfobacteriota bacterium]